MQTIKKNMGLQNRFRTAHEYNKIITNYKLIRKSTLESLLNIHKFIHKIRGF